VSAARAYLRAANERSELGRPRIKHGIAAGGEDLQPSRQAVRIGRLWKQKGAKVAQELKQIRHDLVYGPDTNKAEEALRKMGQLLGVEASRPDNHFGTGPDVLWRAPEYKAGVALEAKTNKKDDGRYRKKDDIGQFHDHVQWLEKTYPDEAFRKVIVGKKLRVSDDANPPQDLCVITLDPFQNVAARLEELYQYVGAASKSDDVEVCVERGLNSLGLVFPNCVDALESSLVVDLSVVEPPSASAGD
jgi:hypothetical protein